MTLYRYNLRLAQELLTIVSCFEVSLRNAIDDILVPQFGNEWLKDSVSTGGMRIPSFSKKLLSLPPINQPKSIT